MNRLLDGGLAEDFTLFASAGTDLDAMRREYLRLTRVALPLAAEAGGWPIRLDHCFMRIVLDHTFGRRWTDA